MTRSTSTRQRCNSYVVLVPCRLLFEKLLFFCGDDNVISLHKVVCLQRPSSGCVQPVLTLGYSKHYDRSCAVGGRQSRSLKRARLLHHTDVGIRTSIKCDLGFTTSQNESGERERELRQLNIERTSAGASSK